MLPHVTTWNFSSKDVSMIGPSGKKWLAKYGWCAHLKNSSGYFTTGWTTFAVDNEFKVDNKLLFTITSPSSIILKILGMTEVMLSVDDKANEDDFENDIEKEDIVDDEDYMDKDEDDKDDVDDDDDDKVVMLTSKNEKRFYQYDDSTVLISFDQDKDDENLPKIHTPWLHQHIN
jgi:hypothetical protein